MGDEFCQEHCIMKEHVHEAPEIRKQVTKNTTKLDNFDTWIPKIEAKVDAIPELLNGFYMKIMLSLGILNIGTMIIMKYLGG